MRVITAGQLRRSPWGLLSATDTAARLREFTTAGLAGGALYGGLAAAAAREHRLPLITCDRRATPTYRALDISYELLKPDR